MIKPGKNLCSKFNGCKEGGRVHSTQLQKKKRINISADSDKKVTDYKMDIILNQSQYSDVK